MCWERDQNQHLYVRRETSKKCSMQQILCKDYVSLCCMLIKCMSTRSVETRMSQRSGIDWWSIRCLEQSYSWKMLPHQTPLLSTISSNNTGEWIDVVFRDWCPHLSLRPRRITNIWMYISYTLAPLHTFWSNTVSLFRTSTNLVRLTISIAMNKVVEINPTIKSK